MGEVYRARDTSLGRDVALKVLPDSLSADRDRLGRFEREASVLASLNHPNIAHVYGLERSSDTSALVMELIDGDDLSQLIAAGPLRVDRAVAIALQIADALAAAHERGIVHRDLKPANIKIRRDGVVKVLDFGLAKAVTAQPLDQTKTRHDLTEAGVVLGTAAYMSPEQCAGDAVDTRTDIWSFGCVLFEMIAGRKPFAAATNADLFGAVLKADPDWNAIASAPQSLQALVRRCLQKDRTRRLGSMVDARLWLEDSAGVSTGPAPARQSRGPWVIAVAASIVAIGVIGVGWWMIGRRPEAPSKVMRLQIALDGSLPATGRPTGVNFALSPDGETLVYHTLTADGFQLARRRLDGAGAVAIPGTVGALNPAFAPDGTRLAFFSRGAIRTVAIGGGAVAVACEVHGVNPFIAWPDGGSIYFSLLGRGLGRCNENGGPAEIVLTPDASRNESLFFGVVPFPGGRVATVVAPVPDTNARSRLAVYTPGRGLKTVIDDAGSGVYAAGHVIFNQANELRAAPFDARTLEVTAAPTAIAPQSANQLAAASDGTVVYLQQGVTSAGPPRIDLLSHAGRFERTVVEHMPLPRHVRVSPDGRSGVLIAGGLNFGEVWRYDLRSSAPPLKVTFRTIAGFPIWSPDGRDVAFQRLSTTAEGGLNVTRADGSAMQSQSWVSGDAVIPEDWSPDGNTLIYQITTAQSGADLMLFDRSSKSSQPWLQTPFNEAEARFSADGRWVAYVSDQTGRAEVFIRPLDGSGAPIRISADGGHEPHWSASGKSLYFANGSRMMAADLSGSASISASPPRLLFENGFVPYNTTFQRTFDVTPDDRFLVVHADTAEQPQPLVVLLNALSHKR